MSEHKLIAESRTFEQQMIDRDKRATKAGFVVGGVGLLIAVLALVAVVVMLPLKQTDVDLYTVDTSALPSPVGRPTAKSGEVNDEKVNVFRTGTDDVRHGMGCGHTTGKPL